MLVLELVRPLSEAELVAFQPHQLQRPYLGDSDDEDDKMNPRTRRQP